MNPKQRILAIIALVLFALTCLSAPFELSGASNESNKIVRRPIFLPPKLGIYNKRAVESSLAYTWIALAVLYGGIHVLLREPKKPNNSGQRQRQRQRQRNFRSGRKPEPMNR